MTAAKREPPVQPGETWEGGRLRAPMYLTQEERVVRPDVVLWLEPQQNMVVGCAVVYPEDPASVVVNCLQRTMESPMWGPPRQPATLRVSDAALAALLRAAVPGTQVVCGPTPQLHEALQELRSAHEEERAAPTYVDAGRVHAAAVERFFGAAAELYARRPWQWIPDDLSLAVEAPAVGLKGACLCVIGALAQSFGFLLFDSFAEYSRFQRLALMASDGFMTEEAPTGAAVLAINFEQGSRLAPSLRREIARAGWPVAGPQAYPVVMRLDPDQLVRPLTDHDYRVATVCAAALARFVEPGWSAQQASSGAARARSVVVDTDTAAVRVDIAAPHPEATLVLEDSTETDVEVASDLVSQRLGERQLENLVDAFVTAQQERGWSQPWCEVAQLAIEQLLQWKLTETDHGLEHWTARHLEYFMLQVFPEAVGGDGLGLKVVPAVYTAFFDYLAAEAKISDAKAETLKRRIAKIQARFWRLVGAAVG